MKIGRIKRPIWSTRKVNNLEGIRLLEVEILPWGDLNLGGSGVTTIVCDNVGAGIGEHIFICTGSAVRDTVFNSEAPFKTMVTAILDQVYIDEKLVKDKNAFRIPVGK